MVDHPNPLYLPNTTLNKIEALFRDYQSSDSVVIAMALISTDGIVIHSTFEDNDWLEELAAMCTAAHALANGLCEETRKGAFAEFNIINISGGAEQSVATVSLEYGLVVAALRNVAKLGGPFTIDNLLEIASYIETLIRTGVEPPPIEWRWGL